MGRKKVKTQTIKVTTPKKRSDVTEKKGAITTLPKNYKFKWDKVKGVNGQIVRITVKCMLTLTVMIYIFITKLSSKLTFRF